MKITTSPFLTTLILPGILILSMVSPSWALTEKVYEAKLPNGLKVLLLEEHKAPVVTVQIWYRVGSSYERPGLTGLSHLMEHMMFKGTPKYGPKTFSQTVQKNGGMDNAFTSYDYTAYFENVASDRMDIALDLESDRMAHLLLDEKEFLSERNVVKEERRMRTEDNPTSYLFERLNAVAFDESGYQWPTIGWMEDLNHLTREDLYHWYKSYYVPNNATLVVVGDFDTSKLLKKINTYFGEIPPGDVPPYRDLLEPAQLGEKRFTVRREAQLPFVMAAYHVPNYKSDDSYALEILSSLLGNGKSSRLYQSLIYTRQMALDAGSEYDMQSRGDTLFYLYGQPLPKVKVEDLEKALYAELDRFKKEKVNSRELQRAKNQVEASFITGQDSNFNRAMLMGRTEAVIGDYRWLDTYLEMIRKVSADDIQRVANTYFTEENRTVGTLIPLPGTSKR